MTMVAPVERAGVLPAGPPFAGILFLISLACVPAVHGDRPRLFMPVLDDVVARSKREPWVGRIADLTGTTHGKALHWLLTGEEASAQAALDDLLAMEPDDGFGLYAQGPVFTLPVTYDWLRGWKGFPEADQKAVASKIEKTADSAVAFLAGKDDSVWHTSAPRSLMGIALAGVALGRADYLAFARAYYEKTYGPAMASLDGGGVAGMSYSMEEGFAPMCYAAHALGLKAAPWWEQRANYIAHQVLPDLSFHRWGDVVTGSRCSFRDEGRHVVDMLARSTGSPAARWLSARIAAQWPNGQGYHNDVLPDMFLFGNDPVEVAGPELPTEALFGQKQIGQAFFRTGWGDADTVVFFKAGDYFDNHGHPDQGQFTIWRKGHLALDGGCYDSFGSRHHKGYALRSAAHNVLLFGTDVAGGQRTPSRQDSQDVADHEAKKRSSDFETGNIVAWRVSPDHACVAADLAAAYDRRVVGRWTRELVFLKPTGIVVVLDRTASGVPPRWLLHCVDEPIVEGQTWTVTLPESQLVGTTLLPRKAAIAKVGPGCLIDGEDFATDKPGEFGVPGAWRVEVSGGPHFLHVLVPTDRGAAVPEARLADEGGAVTVEVGGKRVAFRKEGVGVTVSDARPR